MASVSPFATTAIRRARPADYEPLLAWLNGIFYPEIPRYFQTEYCHVFYGPESILKTSLILEEDGQYLAHVSLVSLDLRTSLGVLRVGAIGMVAVDRKARGRGLMRLLLEEAHRVALEEGCALAFLGGVRSLYTRFGYEVCGLNYEWMWDRQGRKVDFQASRLPKPEAANILHPLWLQRPLGTVWSPSVFPKLVERPGWEVWRAGQGQSAYALARQEDARILVDGFFGNPEGFCPLMDFLSQRYDKLLYLRHCAGDALLHSWMEASGMDVARKGNGMLKILDASALERAWKGNAPAILRTLVGREFSSSPDDITELRQAIRLLFGDPFDGMPNSDPIFWGWETVSYV